MVDYIAQKSKLQNNNNLLQSHQVSIIIMWVLLYLYKYSRLSLIMDTLGHSLLSIIRDMAILPSIHCYDCIVDNIQRYMAKWSMKKCCRVAS